MRLPLWAYHSYLMAVMLCVLVQQVRNKKPKPGAPMLSRALVALVATLVILAWSYAYLCCTCCSEDKEGLAGCALIVASLFLFSWTIAGRSLVSTR